MINLIGEADFEKAVSILKKVCSTQLINEILISDCGKEYIDFFNMDKKKTDRELCELLIQERGIELFAYSDEVTRKLKEKLLRELPDEKVAELYSRHREKGRKIKAVGYMYRSLCERKWYPGKNYANDFVKTVNFPKVFAGFEGSSQTSKKEFEEIMPRRPAIELKDYQIRMKAKMLEILNGTSKNRNCMVSLPTGGGKTVVAVEAFLEWMQRRFEENKYLIWIAQSEELCEQCISCVDQIWRNKEFILPLRVYRYFGKYSPELEDLQGGVIVCNIQKIYAQLKSEENKEIIEKILSHTGAMIIDEAHRSSTKMYDEVLGLAEELTNHKMFPICGLSATPGRTKFQEEGKKLLNRYETNLIIPEFDEEDIEYREHPLQYFKDKNYLSQTKHIVYKGNSVYQLTDKEIRKMKLEGEGEYPKEFLKTIALDRDNNRRILDAICAIPVGCQTLIYTCTVKQAKFFALYMKTQGYRAAFVDSETKSGIRERIISEFKNGNIQFLFNYGVLTTGFDAPKVEYIVLARPIRSEILYEQIIGRGIRGTEFHGTKLCSIIDFYDNSIIQGEPLSFERFRNYWDIDTEGNFIHENNTNEEDSPKIYAAEKVKRCMACGLDLEGRMIPYIKENKVKKLLVRYCVQCKKNYVSLKFCNSVNFPAEYFKKIEVMC